MEWFGQIPQNWEVMPLWTLLNPRINKNTEGQEHNLLSLSYGRIIRKDIETRTGLLPASFNGYNIIEAGDIVLRLTDLQNDMRSLRSGLAKEHGIITSAYLSLKPTKEGQDTRYFHYLLHSFDLIKGFYNMGEGIRQNLNYDELSKLKLPLPPIDVQSRIATFLNSHIAKIDDSITRYKALSDKLDEYRKAIITKAVTEGIRETRFNKCDFGWVNVIPEKWDIALLSQLYSPVKCYNHGMIEKNLLSLSYGKIKRKNIENAEGLVPDNYEGYNIIEKDDIVLRLTDLQNDQKSLRVGISKERGIVTSAYCSIRPNRNFNSAYYYYLLYAFDISKGFYGMGSGIRQGLNWAELKFLKVQIPSRQEQDEIVAYLDKKCSDIDSSKEKIKAVVKKLEEYKKSLIYNAVTGKIEC